MCLQLQCCTELCDSYSNAPWDFNELSNKIFKSERKIYLSLGEHLVHPMIELLEYTGNKYNQIFINTIGTYIENTKNLKNEA